MKYCEDDVAKYKKKSKKRPPSKAKHKHEYLPCVLEYDGFIFSAEHGMCRMPNQCVIASYCKICGKICLEKPHGYYLLVSHGLHESIELTDLAKVELNPQTRTLPTFRINDLLKQKYVSFE